MGVVTARDPGVPVAVAGASFSYGDVAVLDGVDFTVESGELAVLTGENGAGKSTLLKLVLGEKAPSSGAIRLFGSDAARFRDWARVGYMPQRAAATYDRFPANVGEVVLAGRYARTGLLRRYGPRDRAAAHTALAEVHLEALVRRPVSELSGGQLQRVLLARALVCEPELLVLDEPTSGLDERAARDFMALVAQLRRARGTAILLVTHDLKRLDGLDGAVYRLERGKVRDA